MKHLTSLPFPFTALILIAFGFLAFGNSATKTNTSTAVAAVSATGEVRRPLSLISIIADPSKYHGRELEVMAFFSYNETHGQYILSPDLDSIGQDLAANCVYLDVSHCAERGKLEAVGNPAVCILRGTVDTNYVNSADYPIFACGFRATKCILSARLRPKH